MTPTEAIKAYITRQRLADALGITRQAVQQWVNRDEIPLHTQFEIEELTRGRLLITWNDHAYQRIWHED